eukprot:m.140892 g.140892  ORF g.140892 m.140892 type:complete len:257 (-) comp15970_c2_seq1:79-849(-)
MPRLEFKQVRQLASWQKIKAGEIIVDESNALRHFYLVVEGVVDIDSIYHGIQSTCRQAYSGDFFDMHLANMFGVKIGFQHEHFLATAQTDCLVLVWPVAAIDRMASAMAPAVASYWRNMILYTIASELNRTEEGVRLVGSLDAHGNPEDEGWLQGERSRDFSPLGSKERPRRPTFWRSLRWVGRSYTLCPPRGIRHNALPITGVLAKNRLAAIVESLPQRDHKSLQEQRFKSGAISNADTNALREVLTHSPDDPTS